jgi:predicted phage tail protein
MHRIYVYGKLKKLMPKEMKGQFQCYFTSAAEAAAALEANFPGFHDAIRQMELEVFIGNPKDKKSLTEAELHWKVQRDIHIMPAMKGSGGGTGKIILGAVMIIAAAVLTFFTGGMASPLLGMAIGMAIGGAGMIYMGMTAPPEMQDQGSDDLTSAKRTSSLYGGPLNTSQLGDCVPVVVGRDILVGGSLISGDLRVHQLLSMTEGSEA